MIQNKTKNEEEKNFNDQFSKWISSNAVTKLLNV